MTPTKKALTSVGAASLLFASLWLGVGWDPLIPGILAAGTWGGLQFLIPTKKEDILGLSSGPSWVPEEELGPFLTKMKGTLLRIKKLAEAIPHGGAKANVEKICLRLEKSMEYIESTRQLLPGYKSVFEFQAPNIEVVLRKYSSVKGSGVNNADTDMVEQEFLPKMVRGFTALRDALSTQERQDIRAVAHTALNLFDMEGFNLEQDPTSPEKG